MIQWGINALNHGSSLAVFKNGEYQKNIVATADTLPAEIIRAELDCGAPPDEIYWYENPWMKKARQVYAGQYDTAFSMKNLPSKYLKDAGLGYARLRYTPHHASHAAAGYYTSPFNHCAVVVADAIGEFECVTVWNCLHGEMKKVWSLNYPHSLGLFYSAFTKLLGLTPIKDEHILQQMASLGDPKRYKTVVESYFKGGSVEFDYNFHRGVLNWAIPFRDVQDQCDLAAAVQKKFESMVASVMFKAQDLTGSDCLVYMGGCAMNSEANRKFLSWSRFKYVWSLPDPGDASSSIGAVLYHTKQRVWRDDWAPVKHLEIKV